MLLRHYALITILTFLSFSDLVGQDKLGRNLVSDSLILKHKLKQVTENWFTDTTQRLPANTTIETYNEVGQKIKRVHINYSYHKFIEEYEYDLKRNKIIKTQFHYDWSHNIADKKGDTIIKKTVSKFDLHSRMNLKTKRSNLEKFEPLPSYEINGRLKKRIDTIKCGYQMTYYYYDHKGRVNTKKYFISRHEEKPHLFAIDSLAYNSSHQLIKESKYNVTTNAADKMEVKNKILLTYNYTQKGLIKERTKVTINPSLLRNEPKPSVYTYQYEFYER